MPPRNKRKRPVKAEPSGSDSDSASDEQALPKRVKAEVKTEVEVEELGCEDFAIVLSDCELSDSTDRRTGRPVRRSAGGRPPRRGADVRVLYEEAGVGQLARSLGQIVKEEGVMASVVSDVKVEDGGDSPLRVSDHVRRAAAERAAQLLRGDEDGSSETSDAAARNAELVVRRGQKQSRRKRSSGFKFTEEQRAVLRALFDADPYPGRATKEDLSEHLGVKYMSVHHWFHRERRRRGLTNSNYNSARNMCKFGPAVYDELVAQFERNPRPDLATRKALAVKAGGSVQQIYHWFSFRHKSEQDSTHKVEITPAFRAELEAVFTDNPYPDRETQTALVMKFGCSTKQISTWFNRRRKKAGMCERNADHARRVCPFGPEGYDRLVCQYESDPYPDTETKVALAAELDGTVKQVSTWFNSRRASKGIASRANEKRQKCSLGPAAYDELVAAFEADPFPDRKTREALAAKTGGTLQQISSWFCGRRRTEGIRSRSDAYARSKCSFGAQFYDELVAQFAADPFPDRTTVKMLAHKAGGSHEQIRKWFTHRRKRFGMQRSSEQGARLACKFGPEVYDQLAAQFEVDPYPSTNVIKELAEEAGATATQIRAWFASRRHTKHHRQKQK